MDNTLHHLTPEEQEALRATFQSQALELLDAINEGLLQLEAGRAEPRSMQALQRALHTLKGDAGAFGLTALVQVAHRMEDLLVAAAEGRVALDRDRLAVLFQAADACEHLLRADGEGPGPEAEHVAALLGALAAPPGTAPRGVAALGPSAERGRVAGGPAGDGRGDAGPRKDGRSGEAPAAPPAPTEPAAGEALAFTEYDRLAAADAEARGLTLFLLRADVDPRCRMVGAGAFLLLRHLQGAGEILRSDPPLEGPVPDGCRAFTLLLASGLAGESLERRCLLPGIVATARALPFSAGDQGARAGDRGTIDDSRLTIVDCGAERTSAPGLDGEIVNRQSSIVNRQSETAGPAAAATSTILVDTRRVDRVMNQVGELVIARSMFHQALADLQARFPKADFLAGLREAHRLMDRSLADLQKGVMKIRMVPIDRVFRRLPRLVRDLAEASGGAKTARLVLEGRATELDKGIVDALGEPLVHLIRNAVDHGIEPAAARQAAGKPPAGTVRVAARAEGNQIVVEVEDDGRGIDPAAIRRAAVAQALVQAEAADALSDAQALDLIFLPRFTTAAHVTDTSGRGIGMDAVRVSLEGLKGQIHVASQVGRGTTFTLRVPLTLAIMRAMLFRVADRLFALPLSTIAEIARVDPAAVRTVDGHEVLRLRDRVISLLRLREALDLAPIVDCGPGSSGANGGGSEIDNRQSSIVNPAHPADAQRRLYVLIVALAEQRIGLVVDGLQGEGELVIKALEADWVSQAPIAGGAILGDGRVVLILDPGALIQRALARGRAAALGIAECGMRNAEDRPPSPMAIPQSAIRNPHSGAKPAGVRP